MGTSNSNDLIVLDGNSIVVGSVRCVSSISGDFLMALETEKERGVVIQEMDPLDSLIVDAITLDVAYLSDDVLIRIMLALEIHAKKCGLTTITLYASEIAASSIYEDLGYQTKAYLNSVSLRLLKKNLIVN